MMERKLWGFFSATHVVTIIGFITLAVAVPSGVWAVTSFTYNALYNPSNGQIGYIDAARRLWVTDSVLEQSAVPANFVHAYQYAATPGACVVLAMPPSGKAFVVREVRLNVYSQPSPPSGLVAIYPNTTCSGNLIGDVNPPTVGQYVVPFDPGLGTTLGMSFSVGGSVRTEAYLDAYLVPAGQVPAGAAAIAASVKPAQGRSPNMVR